MIRVFKFYIWFGISLIILFCIIFTLVWTHRNDPINHIIPPKYANLSHKEQLKSDAEYRLHARGL
jgi:hypothetical protein